MPPVMRAEGGILLDELKQAVSDVLDTLLSVERQEDGTFVYEIYADYRRG